MNFNPAALLPGAAPPKRDATPSAVSFDEPVVVKTLDNVAKVSLNVLRLFRYKQNLEVRIHARKHC